MKNLKDKITATARYGSKDGCWRSRSNRRTAKNALRDGNEDLPTKQNMRSHIPWGLKKENNYNISPLMRFLNKNAGRPWNDVYSELCQRVNTNNRVQRQALDAALFHVSRNIRIIDGEPYEFNPYCSRSDRYVKDGQYVLLCEYPGGNWQDMYVDPDDGILKFAPCHSSRKNRLRYNRDNYCYKPPHDPLTQYWLIKGEWFEVRFRRPNSIEKSVSRFGKWDNYPIDWDNWKEEKITILDMNSDPFYSYESTSWRQCDTTFGSPIFPVAKRQLNKKEVARIKMTIEEEKRKAKQEGN